jgi:O-antigen ligase
MHAHARSRLLEGLLLATVLTTPWTKLYLAAGGKVELSYIFASLYVLTFLALRTESRDWRIPRPVLGLLCFYLATLAVDGAGFLGLNMAIQRTEFEKEFGFVVLHGAFMVCAAAHMTRGGMRLLRRAVGWFVAGFTVSAAYGVAQLAAHVLHGGMDLDRKVIDPIPLLANGSTGVLLYGANLWRITGLTLDTNHLGVMMVVPIALAATWWGGLRRPLVVGCCLLALALTLSRSGALALVGGVAYIAWRHRRRLLRPAVVLAVVGALIAVLVVIQLLVVLDRPLAQSLIFGRLDPNSSGVNTHFALYGTIPDLVAQSPLVGLGLNSFALHFVDTSGRADFGPHSAYIKLIVENGLLGTGLYVVYITTVLGWLARVRTPLAIGLGAAIVGTLAGNVFYLTTHFMYDDILLGMSAALVGIYAAQRAAEPADAAVAPEVGSEARLVPAPA